MVVWVAFASCSCRIAEPWLPWDDFDDLAGAFGRGQTPARAGLDHAQLAPVHIREPLHLSNRLGAVVSEIHVFFSFVCDTDEIFGVKIPTIMPIIPIEIKSPTQSQNGIDW